MTIIPTSPCLLSIQGASTAAFVASTPLVAGHGEHAERLLARFGAETVVAVPPGCRVEAGRPLLVVRGDLPPAPLEAARRLLGRACGIATAAASLVEAARSVRPDIEVLCPHPPRRSVRPSVLAGGMAIEPEALARASDIRDFTAKGDPAGILRFRSLRAALGTPAVIVMQRPEDIDDTVLSLADMVVLEGFTPDQARMVRDRTFGRIPTLNIAVKAGIHAGNAVDYAASGARMLITPVPLSAPSAEITLIRPAATEDV